MAKILTTIGQAGMAAMVGYEVGQITKEQEPRVIMHDNLPTPYRYEPKENNADIKEIMYIIILLLVIGITLILAKFLTSKKTQEPETIKV